MLRTGIAQRIIPLAALAVAAVANAYVFWTTDLWLRWVNLVVASVMVWAGYRVERNRRDLNQWLEDTRWDLAAASPDPIGTMARMQYLDRLTIQQVREINEWFASAAEDVDYHLDDLPPLVRDFILAGEATGREGA